MSNPELASSSAPTISEQAQKPSEKQGSLDRLENVAALQALPPETKAKISVTLANIESAFPDETGRKNQKEKFLNALSSNMDPSDPETSKELVEMEVANWETKILPKSRAVAKETVAVAKETQVADTENSAKKEGIKDDIALSDNVNRFTEALSQKLTTLSGGKTPEQLLPDYSTKLAQTQKHLASTGQDPELAKGIVLLTYQADIIKSIESTTGKKLSERDANDLQQEFGKLRGMMPKGVEVPPDTAGNIALANPKVTLEAYSKIRLGFEPPTQIVYTNSKNGEIISPPALLTGERTVMTANGDRFREKDGLRIMSSVPKVSEAETLVQELDTNRQQLGSRSRLTSAASKEVQGEFLEKFPHDQFPRLKLPPLNTANPTELQRQLTWFVTSPTYREILEHPEQKHALIRLTEDLKKLYQSVNIQAALTKNIKEIEAKNPEGIIRTQIAEQDRIVDANLARLSQLGMGSLGQEKYDKLRDAVNKKLKAESSPPIDDQKPMTAKELRLLGQALVKLTGMDEAQMYPDGRLSPTAASKLKELDASQIESMLSRDSER